MTYRTLERFTLWFLTITMFIMFLFSSFNSNTLMDLNTELIDMMESNRELYGGVIEGYRTMVQDLKIENAILEEENKQLKGEK